MDENSQFYFTIIMAVGGFFPLIANCVKWKQKSFSLPV